MVSKSGNIGLELLIGKYAFTVIVSIIIFFMIIYLTRLIKKIYNYYNNSKITNNKLNESIEKQLNELGISVEENNFKKRGLRELIRGIISKKSNTKNFKNNKKEIGTKNSSESVNNK